MARSGWYRHYESGELHFWDGEKWEDRPRLRHPDFQPPVPSTKPRNVKTAVIVTAVMSALLTTVGLNVCAASAGHASPVVMEHLFSHR